MVVRMEHPAVTADTEPFVVGRFLPEKGEAMPAKARIVRMSARGRRLRRRGPAGERRGELRGPGRGWRSTARTASGSPPSAGPAGQIELRTPEFAIVHGVSIADPPLSRSVGVALSDDSVQVYFEKGTPLPARRTEVVQTIRRVPAGSAEAALAIPVVQGELSKAHLNRLIGSLEIQGARLKRDLPAGSRVEVTLHLDRSGQLHARADVPEAGESFEDVVHVLVPSAPRRRCWRGSWSPPRSGWRRCGAGGSPAAIPPWCAR